MWEIASPSNGIFTGVAKVQPATLFCKRRHLYLMPTQLLLLACVRCKGLYKKARFLMLLTLLVQFPLKLSICYQVYLSRLMYLLWSNCQQIPSLYHKYLFNFTFTFLIYSFRYVENTEGETYNSHRWHELYICLFGMSIVMLIIYHVFFLCLQSGSW